MKKFAWLTVLILLAAACRADIFTVTDLNEGTDRLAAREKSSGRALWQSEIKRQKRSSAGKEFLYQEEKGAGIWGKDKKQLSWLTESFSLLSGGALIPYQVKTVFKDPQGQTVVTQTKYYDRESKKVICGVNGRNREFEFRPDLLDKENLGVCLQHFPFGAKKEMVFHLLTHEPAFYKINLKYLGTETITAAAGPVECHKLEMIPDLGAANIFGVFIPKTYFWYAVAAPHRFVRYEGLESGLGTPYIVLDAVPR